MENVNLKNEPPADAKPVLSVRCGVKKLIDITDEDAIKAAAIAKIGNNPTIVRTGRGKDKDCIIISDGAKDRSVRINFNGSNTRVLDRGYEVIEYCFDIYDFLRSIGYDWKQ